jgi:hypothetical protein
MKTRQPSPPSMKAYPMRKPAEPYGKSPQTAAPVDYRLLFTQRALNDLAEIIGHIAEGRPRIFAYLSLTRARAAGSTSSGGSTTQVRTYCKSEFVRATCVWTKVKRDCTSFAIFARVAAMRDSNWAVASVLSPCRSCCSQAAMRNACSERKSAFFDRGPNPLPQFGGRVPKIARNRRFSHGESPF